MKKKGVPKDLQSNPKTLHPYHRRASLRTKTVNHKPLKTNYKAVDSQKKCTCGMFMSKKRKAKNCLRCEMDFKVITKYPEQNLKVVRVSLVNLAASSTSSSTTDKKNLSRVRVNLNRKRKLPSEIPKGVRRQKYPKTIVNTARTPKKDIKNPSLRMRNPKLKKSIKSCEKSVTKKAPVKKTTGQTSRAAKAKSLKHGQSNSGREGAKCIVKKKRNIRKAKRTVNVQSTKSVNVKKKIVRRSRMRANCSRDSSHKCRECGVTCESNVGKLVHEFNHQNKLACVILDQCDESRFIPIGSDNGERSDPSTQLREVDRRIENPIESNSSELREHGIIANDTSTEVALGTSPIQQCSELEKLYTRSDIQSANSDTKNEVNDYIVSSDLYPTEVKSNASWEPIQESTRSSCIAASLVETVGLRALKSSHEFPQSFDGSSADGFVASSQARLHSSSETRDRNSHGNALEVDQLYSTASTISSSVNASQDHSDSELLIDEECQDDSMDAKSDASNLESRDLTYCDPVNDSQHTENTPISEVVDECYEGVGMNEHLLGRDEVATDETSCVEASVSVSDAALAVEVAKVCVDIETTTCVGVQKANGSALSEECAEEEAYECDSDSESATFGDDNENNLLNEGPTDFTGNSKYSPALEHSEASVHESGTAFNVSHERILNPDDSDSVNEIQLKYVSVVKEDKSSDLHSLAHHSADVDLFEGSARTGILEASVSWSGTSCNLDVMHTAVSRHSTSESPSNSTSGEPPVGLSDLTSPTGVPDEDSEQEEVSVMNSISVME